MLKSHRIQQSRQSGKKYLRFARSGGIRDDFANSGGIRDDFAVDAASTVPDITRRLLRDMNGAGNRRLYDGDIDDVTKSFRIGDDNGDAIDEISESRENGSNVIPADFP